MNSQKPISILQNTNLAAIHLIHTENGLTDPTTDELLHLVRGSIYRQRSSSEHVS